MKILFYLPVVTPWWFHHIIAPLVRHLAVRAEVHVMVPPMWSGTGIRPEQVAAFADCDAVEWHILDGDDHPKLRSSAADFGDLIALVQSIDADITLCRSADLETPRRFPGIVKFIMEGGFPPFPSPEEWIVFRDHPFDHGVMPALDAEERDRLSAAFAPAWTSTRHRFGDEAVDRGTLLDRIGLPRDRAVIGLPLEYEHPENFFAIHRSIRSNADLVPALADALGGDVLLAVTDHPLNDLYCDRAPLRESLARLGDRVVMVEAAPGRERPTFDLAQACSGMIFDNSKTISVAGFFGTPIARTASWQTGTWLNAANDLAAFARAARDGTAAAPDEAEARAWFAFHVANSVLNLSHPDVDAELILDMIEKPVDPHRWEAGLRRYADVYPELFQ